MNLWIQDPSQGLLLAFICQIAWARFNVSLNIHHLFRTRSTSISEGFLNGGPGTVRKALPKFRTARESQWVPTTSCRSVPFLGVGPTSVLCKMKEMNARKVKWLFREQLEIRTRHERAQETRLRLVWRGEKLCLLISQSFGVVYW